MFTQTPSLDKDALHRKNLYVQPLLQTHPFSTETLSHTNTFTHTHTHTHAHLFTHRRLYTRSLHTDTFRYRSLHAQALSHTGSLRHRRFHTQKTFTDIKDALTHSSLYIYALLHTNAFTQMREHTDTPAHTCIREPSFFGGRDAAEPAKVANLTACVMIDPAFVRQGFRGTRWIAIPAQILASH